MKRAKSAICVIMMMFVISACAGRTSNDSAVSMREQEEIPGEAEETTLTASPENGSNGMPELEDTFGNGDVTIGLSVGGQTDSEAVRSFDVSGRAGEAFKDGLKLK